MKDALLYLFLMAFLLSPVIWLIGPAAIAFMVVVYLVVVYLNFSAKFIPLIIKLINLILIIAVFALCSGMIIAALSCPAGNCANAGLVSISTFVISLPAVVVLMLLNGWLYRASLNPDSGMDFYHSLMYLSRSENWE